MPNKHPRLKFVKKSASDIIYGPRGPPKEPETIPSKYISVRIQESMLSRI